MSQHIDAWPYVEEGGGGALPPLEPRTHAHECEHIEKEMQEAEVKERREEEADDAIGCASIYGAALLGPPRSALYAQCGPDTVGVTHMFRVRKGEKTHPPM